MSKMTKREVMKSKNPHIRKFGEELQLLQIFVSVGIFITVVLESNNGYLVVFSKYPTIKSRYI